MKPRTLRALGPVILIVAAVVAIVIGLAYGGGAAPLDLGDPGPLARWGLPIAKMFVNISLAGALGALVMALFAFKPGDRAYDVLLDTASFSAAALTVASGAAAFFNFILVFNPQVSLGPDFGQQLGRYLTDNPLGTAWLLTVIGAAVLTVLTFAWRSWLATLFAAVLTVVVAMPMVTQGHAGDLANHNLAVSSLGMHVIGAGMWIGGLLAVVIVRPHVKAITTTLQRYSSLALAAFIVVAASGVVRAFTGLGDWQYLFSPYGVLVIAKVIALLMLGIFGALYRTKLIAKTDTAKTAKPFWALVALELAVMGIASGVAAALARTPSPVALLSTGVSRTPAERLSNAPLPPELTLPRWFSEWNIDILWLSVGIGGIVLYLMGVYRLHRRGDRWPIYRTVFWIVGMLLLIWVTCGPINAYQAYLFSVHMMGHMLLAMAIPLLLVFGSAVTLLLRAVDKRRDGTRGVREWVLWAIHSPYSKVITHPIVAAGIFVGSLWLFYYSDLFRWALYDHVGHIWMVAHFLISGYLFVLTLVGIDPIPFRLPYAGRLITLVAVAAMHAFFGMAIMMNEGLMAAEWYGSMGRAWGNTPMEDQYVGGGIAWSIGEIPTLITGIVIAIQWSRSDERLQRSRDRHADRTGDAELEEYNAKLAKMAERDAERTA